jgi:hypothetical protein
MNIKYTKVYRAEVRYMIYGLNHTNYAYGLTKAIALVNLRKEIRKLPEQYKIAMGAK